MPEPLRVALVGISLRGAQPYRVQDYLDELALLAQTAGATVQAQFIQSVTALDPRTFIGRGKVAEIAQCVAEQALDLVVFDDELSPTQHRNLEKELGCQVQDRTGLILTIFAQRARTAYAKKQVELAQYEYLLPRLVGMWTHLERQRGGLNMRGPGERELETDRRIVRTRIAKLKDDLRHIDTQMATQRKLRGGLPRVALVGYTNAGKSSLLNALASEHIYVENQLFATLDTTVRRISLGPVSYLLADTVGFIRKLPTQLIEAFRSTLDEVREATLLLHVVDVSHPQFESQMQTVAQTLRDLGILDTPMVLVFNKVDRYQPAPRDEFDLAPVSPEQLSLQELQQSWLARSEVPTIFVSALTGTNLPQLKALIAQQVEEMATHRP